MIAALAEPLCAPFAAGRFRPEPQRVGRVAAFDGMTIEATGAPWPVGQGARIGRGAQALPAELIGFRGGRALFAPLGDGHALAPGMPVHADGHADRVAAGDALLGRVIDARGQPLDGQGPVRALHSVPLHGRAGNVLHRGRVIRPLDTGVRAIDSLLRLGRGQRVALIAGSGVGKSVLMGQLIAGADVDRVVVALVGERGREVSDFIAERLPPALRARAVVVAVPADHPPILRLRAAARATAIAEDFRAAGHQVLLLVDSLTRCAHAAREIGLALGEPPTVKGYTPSSLAMIPRLVERAGVDTTTGGAITAIYTVLADGDDLNDPVVDAARAICDGHVVLSRAIAETGVFPAIDVARSLSRVMPDLVAPDQAAAAAHFRALWSAWDASRDLVLMGAYVPGGDPLTDAAVARRGDLTDWLRQPADARVPSAEAVAALIESFAP